MKEVNEELLGYSTVEAQWDNPSDEKASGFYLRRYLMLDWWKK